MSQKEAAEVVGVTQSKVSKWLTKYKSEENMDALNLTKHTGRPPMMNEEQKEELVKILLKGAESYGFETYMRAMERVSKVIYDKFGIRYHPDHVRKILHSLGLS